MKRRCSSLPLFLHCASSAAEVEAPINTPSDVADLGRAVHEALATFVSTGRGPDLAAVAARYGVDADTIEQLYGYGRQAWREVARYFPHPRAEERVESDLVIGTADVLHADGETLVVLDWKSGWGHRNHRQQVTGYAHGAVAKFGWPSSGRVTCIVVRLRHAEYEAFDLTPTDLAAWEEELARQGRLIGQQYAPGEDCTFCPGQLVCRARAAYLASAREALVPVASGSTTLTPEQLVALYPQVQAYERALEACREAIRHIVTANGPQPLGDGRMLGIREVSKDTIDARAAWPVLLEEGLTEDDLAAVASIAKGALEKVVGAKAPSREKGKRAAAVIRRLREAGAITTTSYAKLETYKAG